MIVIDALPHRHVSPTTTPQLWAQVAAGGRAPMGGLSVPMSVTYANHAAFVTGADPVVTGVYGNHTWIEGTGWVKSPRHGPRARTLFDRVGDCGGRSVMIVGDHKLVAQMGGGRADHVWPPGGQLDAGTERCEFGYATDRAVVDAVGAADLDADLIVLHLNQPDTTSHLHGPDSTRALDQYRATDAAYGELIAQLRDGWDDTIVITLSDHDQETIVDFTPVELIEALDDLSDFDVVHDGTAALLHCQTDNDIIDRIRRIDGVESLAPIGPDVWMAWTEPGRAFGSTPIPIHGQHGSPRCRTQVAVVSGGHERVRELGVRIEQSQPSALDWAPLIADLLDLEHG
jgi:hypothetical protein